MGALANGASATLTVNATVDSDVSLNVPLATRAIIMEAGAGSYLTRSDADPRGSNDISIATVTPPSNHNPAFRIQRTVDENTPPGTILGDPIPAFDRDGDAPAYAITGPGANQFAVDSSGHISVAWDADTIDYECRTSYRPDLAGQRRQGPRRQPRLCN